MTARRAVGIDLSGKALHVATIASSAGSRAEVVAAGVYLADELEHVVEACAGADAVAIDAPASASQGCHAADRHLKKYAPARCAEIAAAEQLGVWVPWITPLEGDRLEPWMELGFRLWRRLEAAGHQPMEVYPAGSFWLHERRWPPKKTTAAGLRARLAILDLLVTLPDTAAFWSHDAIDAVLAGVVALQGRDGATAARHARGGCDSSELWFLGPFSRPGAQG